MTSEYVRTYGMWQYNVIVLFLWNETTFSIVENTPTRLDEMNGRF